MKFIPTYSDPFYEIQVLLDGANYLFLWNYSQREACWRLSIQDSDGTELVSGLKIVCNVDLLNKYVDSRLPPGRLVALPTGDTSPPGLTDFGIGLRVVLIYIEAADITP